MTRPIDSGDSHPIHNLRAAAWMTTYSVCFALATLAVKAIGGSLPIAEIGFLRSLLGMVVVVPALAKYGFRIYRTQRPGLHIVRVICAGIGMLGSYYGISRLPLATAVAFNFTRPLFMIIIATAFLGEKVRWRRGLATVLIGFGGALIVLDPADLGLDWAAIAALAGAAGVAGAMAVIRQQSAVDGVMTLFVWYATGITVIAFFPAMADWRTPNPSQWTLLAFIAFASAAGQFCLFKALATGEATVMNPIDYIQIILAAVFGYFFFDEVVGKWTILGTALIVASTLYILFREARIKQGLPSAATFVTDPAQGNP